MSSKEDKKTLLSKYADISRDGWVSPFRSGETPTKQPFEPTNVEVSNIKLETKTHTAKKKLRTVKRKMSSAVRKVRGDKDITLQTSKEQLGKAKESEEEEGEKEEEEKKEDDEEEKQKGEVEAKEEKVEKNEESDETDAQEATKDKEEKEEENSENKDIVEEKDAGTEEKEEPMATTSKITEKNLKKTGNEGKAKEVDTGEENVDNTELVSALEQQAAEQKSLGEAIHDSRFSNNSSSSSSSDESSDSEKPSHVLLTKTDPNLKKFATKPKMLYRYKQNVNMARGSLNKKNMKTDGGVIKIGTTMNATISESKLMEIARKRVDPVLKAVDEQIAKQNAVDEEEKKELHTEYTAKDERKVGKILGKFQKKLDKQTDQYIAEHQQALANIAAEEKKSREECDTYVGEVQEQEKQDVIDADDAEDAAKKEFEEEMAESKANHEELKLSTEKELNDTREAQKKAEEDTLHFNEEGQRLSKEAEEKSAELQKKEGEIDAITSKLQAAIAAKQVNGNKIRDAKKDQKIYARTLTILNDKHQRAALNNEHLSDHTDLLRRLVSKHKAELEREEGSEKERVEKKREAAIISKEEWERKQDAIHTEAAEKQERVIAQKRAEEAAVVTSSAAAAAAEAAPTAAAPTAAAPTAAAPTASSTGVESKATKVKTSEAKTTKEESEEDTLGSAKESQPIFTEVVEPKNIGKNVRGGSNESAVASSYDEVVSYEPISKEEYEANQSDPNYMVL